MHHLVGKWPFVIAAALAVLLVGCKPEKTPPLAVSSRAMAMAAEPGTTDRRIAFSHAFAVELPSAVVEITQQKNLTACLAGGCTVLNTHIDRLRDGLVQASISVRIAPDRYPAFAAAITAPPATLVSHTETAEDKTIPLIDVEKRLDAQLALRDRLSQMLKQVGTSVTDLVAVEKQLADVQGAIESATAQRNYLRSITDTVKVDVAYNGLIQQAGPFDVSPIRAALDNFVRIVIESLGDMIAWIAYALPWLPLVVLAGWVVRRLVRPRFP
ncbi:MAG: DUF4349 domain-containing protein [Rhodopila sp.]|nr:DUF4349 domain-containing protein [Rhodopila sp.]